MELKNYVKTKMKKLSSLKNDIPLPIRLFLGKALFVFVLWQIVYLFFFKDSKVLDHPLTTHVAEASVFFLNNLTPMSGFYTSRVDASWVYEGEHLFEEASEILHNNKLVLYIADSCNGLELIILYIGFIICMPSPFWRKVLYIVIGIVLLDLINIARCIGLIYLREYLHAYFQFAHKYVFKITVYIATFIIWRFYARKINLKNEIIPIG